MMIINYLNYLLLLILICFSCTKTKEILVPGEDIIIIKDSSKVVYQIFNTSYADDVLSVSGEGDFIDRFVTGLVFNYNGEITIDVAVVRNLILWGLVDGEDILIGKTRGYIAKYGIPTEAVSFMFPEEHYVYVVVWDGGKFNANNSFYTNYYSDAKVPGLSKGKSIKNAIAEWTMLKDKKKFEF